MCIYCNLPGMDGTKEAGDFLDHFAGATKSMRKASNALLQVADACNPADAKRYRSIQKRMVRLRREWARLEHERERTG